MSATVRSVVQPLSRCCLEALERRAPENPTPGEAIRCEWCGETVIFRDGEWEGSRTSRPA